MLSKSASIISHIEDGLWTEVVCRANPEEKVYYDYAVQYFTVICIHVTSNMSYNNEKPLQVEYILQRLICHAMRWQESIW